MRLVQVKNGVCELSWMWLPVFIGQNTAMLRQLQVAMAEHFKDAEATEANLDTIHSWVVEWLDTKHGIKGLGAYLRAISAVTES